MTDGFQSEKREPTPEERKQKLEREQLSRSFKKIFLQTGPDGKLVLSDIVNRCHVFGITFNAHNAKLQDFAEGERNIGNYILAQCEMQDTEKLKQLQEKEI